MGIIKLVVMADKVFSEIAAGGAQLKHAETVDKSAPVIEGDVKIGKNSHGDLMKKSKVELNSNTLKLLTRVPQLSKKTLLLVKANDLLCWLKSKLRVVSKCPCCLNVCANSSLINNCAYKK